jgi:hypothetical protein
MCYNVQFTGYKINPDTGEPYRWHWGPYDDYNEALELAIKWGEYHKKDAFTTVEPCKRKRR